MLLQNFRPQSKLVTKTTRVEKPRFPAIDAHNHLAEPFGGGWDRKPLSELLDQLDQAGIVHYVDLDGGWGEELLNFHLDYFKAKAPEALHDFWRRGLVQVAGTGQCLSGLGCKAAAGSKRTRRGWRENLETVRAARP